MKLYISGAISAPTREEELKNLQRFNDVERELRQEGFDVFNPASLEVPNGVWEYYLARDMVWIYENRPALYLLTGWEQSRGARLEVELARLLGLNILYE